MHSTFTRDHQPLEKIDFKKYFHITLGTIVSLDWAFLYPDLHFFWGEPKLLQYKPSPFFDTVVDFFSNAFGCTLDTSILMLWWLTFFLLLAFLFPPLRKITSFLLWIMINLWLTSYTGALNGVYYYYSTTFLLVFLSLWSKNENLLWTWGKVFLTLTYFNAGYAKIQSDFWTSGELLRLFFISSVPKELLAKESFFAAFVYFSIFASFVVILTQLFSPLILWKKSWSRPWAIIDSLIHFLAIYFLNLYFFSVFLIFLNMSYYFTPAKMKEIHE